MKQIKKIEKVLMVLIATILLGACQNNKEELLYDDFCQISIVSFKDDIFPMLASSCSIVGCHVQGGTGVGLFENYEQVKSKIDDGSISVRVLIQQDMPPLVPLSDCQLLFLSYWIEDGALNN